MEYLIDFCLRNSLINCVENCWRLVDDSSNARLMVTGCQSDDEESPREILKENSFEIRSHNCTKSAFNRNKLCARFHFAGRPFCITNFVCTWWRAQRLRITRNYFSRDFNSILINKLPHLFWTQPAHLSSAIVFGRRRTQTQTYRRHVVILQLKFSNWNGLCRLGISNRSESQRNRVIRTPWKCN